MAGMVTGADSTTVPQHGVGVQQGAGAGVQHGVGAGAQQGVGAGAGMP